jgi:hypothetical protein
VHPKDILNHACIRHRFASGVMHSWEFERDGETDDAWWHGLTDLDQFTVQLDWPFPNGGCVDFIPAGQQDPQRDLHQAGRRIGTVSQYIKAGSQRPYLPLVAIAGKNKKCRRRDRLGE